MRGFYKLQKAAILLLVSYFGFLIYFLVFQDEVVKSLPKNTLKTDVIDSVQGVYMESINRLEFQDGIKKWRIQAKSVNFKEGSGNALFKDPIVTVFDAKSPNPTLIYAKSALVKSEGEIVHSALLEGDVKMITSTEVTIESQVAEYSSSNAKVFVPDDAKVSGAGYWVKGRNLVVFTELGILEFGNNVESFFEAESNKKHISPLKALRKF